jgi:hypothetical protein
MLTNVSAVRMNTPLEKTFKKNTLLECMIERSKNLDE